MCYPLRPLPLLFFLLLCPLLGLFCTGTGITNKRKNGETWLHWWLMMYWYQTSMPATSLACPQAWGWETSVPEFASSNPLARHCSPAIDPGLWFFRCLLVLLFSPVLGLTCKKTTAQGQGGWTWSKQWIPAKSGCCYANHTLHSCAGNAKNIRLWFASLTMLHLAVPRTPFKASNLAAFLQQEYRVEVWEVSANYWHVFRQYSNQLPQAYCGVTLLPSGGFCVSGAFREIEVLKAAMPFSWCSSNMRIIQLW